MTRIGKTWRLIAASIVFPAVAAASTHAQQKLSMGAQTLAGSIDDNILKRTCPGGRNAMADLVRDGYGDYAKTHRGESLPKSAVPETVQYLVQHLLTQRCRGAK